MSVHKIIIVGDKDVGKVSFKNKIMSINNESSITSNDDQNVMMAVNRFLSWKIGEQSLKIEFKIVEIDEIPAVRDSFYRSASGFICMFAIDNAESFEIAKKMREQILDVRSQTRLILVGNKCDQPKKLRKVSKKEAKSLAKKWKAEYIETSVIENQNLDQCLNTLLQAIIEKKHTRMIKGRSSLKSTLDRFKYYNCLQ